jgi:hypothetical protein
MGAPLYAAPSHGVETADLGPSPAGGRPAGPSQASVCDVQPAREGYRSVGSTAET